MCLSFCSQGEYLTSSYTPPPRLDTAPWNQTCTLGPDMSPRPGMPPSPDPPAWTRHTPLGPDNLSPWDQTHPPRPGMPHPTHRTETPPGPDTPQTRHALPPQDQTWPCDYCVFHREFLWPTSAKLVPNGFQH